MFVGKTPSLPVVICCYSLVVSLHDKLLLDYYSKLHEEHPLFPCFDSLFIMILGSIIYSTAVLFLFLISILTPLCKKNNGKPTCASKVVKL